MGMGLARDAAPLLMMGSVGQAVGTVMLLVDLWVVDALVGEAEVLLLEVGVTASAVEEEARELEGVGWTAEVRREEVEGCAVVMGAKVRVLVAGDCTGVVGLASEEVLLLTGWIVWVVEVQMVEVEREEGHGVVAFLGGTKVEVLLVVQADVTGLGGEM